MSKKGLIIKNELFTMSKPPIMRLIVPQVLCKGEVLLAVMHLDGNSFLGWHLDDFADPPAPALVVLGPLAGRDADKTPHRVGNSQCIAHCC